jgi:hypothetical protein
MRGDSCCLLYLNKYMGRPAASTPCLPRGYSISLHSCCGSMECCSCERYQSAALQQVNESRHNALAHVTRHVHGAWLKCTALSLLSTAAGLPVPHQLQPAAAAAAAAACFGSAALTPADATSQCCYGPYFSHIPPGASLLP